MKILFVSDIVLPQLESPQNLRLNYSGCEMVISCGDLPPAYLDLISSVLEVPLFFVRGNHDQQYGPGEPGGDNLHARVVHYKNGLFGGLEGSIHYNFDSPPQYTESDMFRLVVGLGPRMLLNRLRYGRCCDVMVTHSPLRGVHDLSDPAHRGFRSFHLLVNLYQPRFLVHGHVDVNDRRVQTETVLNKTRIININPMKLFTLDEFRPNFSHNLA